METLGWRGISGFQELRVRAAGRRTFPEFEVDRLLCYFLVIVCSVPFLKNCRMYMFGVDFGAS